MNSTLKFEIVAGFNNGYSGNNKDKTQQYEYICELWQRIAKEEFDKSNIYVSAVIHPSKTVYNEFWGCPKGGEDTVTITGVANREFVIDLAEWKDTVLKLAMILKEELAQSTMTCEFSNIELNYLK